jgi:hypothetical protein
MTKKNMDILVGIIFFALAGFLYIVAGQMPTRDGGIAALNTGFYPRMLSILLGILSISMVVGAVRKQGEGDKAQTWWATKSALIMFLVTFVLLVAYPFVMRYLGFATASFIFIACMTWMLSGNENRNLFFMFGITVVLTSVVYIIFKMVLAIPFPRGLLI